MRILWAHNISDSALATCRFVHQLAEELQRHGAEVELHATGSLRGVSRLAAARRRIRELSAGYDLAHSQFGSACAIATAHTRCRRVLSLRGTDLLGCDTGSPWYRLHGWAARRMTRSALPKFERVVVMSHRMRDELRRYHGRSHGVEVVPSGIDLERFAPRDRQAARTELGHGDDRRPWVVFASQRDNNPVKRPQLALAAFEAAARQRPELVLKTISGVPHAQIPLWMNAANLLLLTSTREGWPNVVKEALASNVPFVSTDVSDLARIAAAEASCIVAPADPTALAAGILTSLASPPSESLRSHVAGMSLRRIAERLLTIYRAVLDSPCRQAA